MATLTLKHKLSEEKVAELNELKKLATKQAPTPKTSLPVIKKTLGWLIKNFPKAFTKGRDIPLKTKIEKDIFEKLPEGSPITKKVIRDTLSFYAGSRSYLQATIDKTHRVALDGISVEEITESHKEYAKERLNSLAERAKNKKK